MSTDSIARHNQKWSDLPLFTATRWVVTDEDIAAWNDIVYMRTLIDDIAAACSALDQPAMPRPRSLEYDIDQYVYPWPPDVVAAELADWRAELDGAAA